MATNGNTRLQYCCTGDHLTLWQNGTRRRQCLQRRTKLFRYQAAAYRPYQAPHHISSVFLINKFSLSLSLSLWFPNKTIYHSANERNFLLIFISFKQKKPNTRHHYLASFRRHCWLVGSCGLVAGSPVTNRQLYVLTTWC